MKRRRNPLRLKKWLLPAALLTGVVIAVTEAPKLGLLAPGGVHPATGAPAGDINSMRANNPNFDSQMTLWKSLRTARGQSPTDWGAFVLYQKGIGAPDPGSLAPAIFA